MAGTATGGAAGSGGGTEVPACMSNDVATCQGTGTIACHFGGAPGNYQVTLELGDSEASEAYVEAEAFRRMLPQATTAAGEAERFSFLINVRQYEGEPVRPDQDSTYPKGTPGLDVYVRGQRPRLKAICVKPASQPVVLWIAGDSTVADQAASPDYAGWGQHLPQFFGDSVAVANYADSGESSVSFLNSGKLWGAIKSGMAAGDWVLIQLGHNDKKTSADTFRSNLTSMLADVRAKDAHAVLLTPISRVGYSLENEHVNELGANLPQIIRALGESEGVPVIDLTATTWSWLQTIEWQKYFALGTDRTHTNVEGAGVIAGFVRDGIQTQVPPLAPRLR